MFGSFSQVNHRKKEESQNVKCIMPFQKEDYFDHAGQLFGH